VKTIKNVIFLYCVQVDNWALGVCIYQWVFGQLPFSGSNTSEVFESICKQSLVLPPEVHISNALADLITSVSPHCAGHSSKCGDPRAGMTIHCMHGGESDGNISSAHCQVLVKDPMDRLSLDAIMRHPWIAPCSLLPQLPRRPSQV
jgi:serine/threonine protein kinase